jgi:hypothetical protein
MEKSEKSQADIKGSIKRFDSIKFGMQEFFISVEETVLNTTLNFSNEISKIFASQFKEEDSHDKIDHIKD